MSRINVDGIGFVDISQAELKSLDAEVSRRNERAPKSAPVVTRESVLAERLGAGKKKATGSTKAAAGAGAKEEAETKSSA